MDYKVKHYMNQNILIKKWHDYFIFYQKYIHPKLDKNIHFFKDIINSSNHTDNQNHGYNTNNQERKDFEYFINVGKINGVSMLPKLYIRKLIKHRDLINVIQFLENAKNSILQIFYQLAKIIKVPQYDVYIGTDYDTIDIPPYTIIDYHKRYFIKILNLFHNQYPKYRLNKKKIIDFIREPFEIDTHVNSSDPNINILNLKFLLYMIFFILNITEDRNDKNDFDLNIEDFFLKSENIPILSKTITIIKQFIIENILSMYEIQSTSIIDAEYDIKTKISKMNKIITPKNLELEQNKYKEQLDSLRKYDSHSHRYNSSNQISNTPKNSKKENNINKIILQYGDQLAKNFPKQKVNNYKQHEYKKNNKYNNKYNDKYNRKYNKFTINKIENPIIQNMAKELYKKNL